VRRALPPILLCLVAAAVAFAGGDSRQQSTSALTENRAGKPTAERFAVDYRNPDDPQARPPAVRKVKTILPRGARYRTWVPGSCTASDAELTAVGGAACPPASAIGGGVVTVDTGVPGPARFVVADVEFFNNHTDPDGEFIYLNTVRGSGARTVIRADLSRRTRVTNVEPLPGTPPDGGAIDTADVTVDEVTRKVGDKRRAYITTPRRCAKRRHWTARVRFTYEDGVTQTQKTRRRCIPRSKGR
jgi:hypothetical protein